MSGKKNLSNSNYNRYNVILGWLAFVIAAITYILTMEPSASLWDCGEFITTANGLEVGHPPGAPFFMILARFFVLFAPDPSYAALMVNLMSALASALTIMFLFWTITHLAKKLFIKDGELSLANGVAIFGAGMVGALAYTFSDTFWFSAVEGEVYALSSLFTAVVFWAILKWENIADEKYANRWIILIAYLMGLSIGVHLLNLLAIPAIVFVYYFRKYEPTRNGVLAALGISLVILGTIMYGIIPGVIQIASKFELIFVNGLGAPFNTGAIVYAIAMIALVVWAISYSIKHNKVILNTIVTSFVVIMIGYSSFAMIVIRSSANPPMDENNPDNVFALLSYLNREQYGDRPLVFGAYYNAPVLDVEYTDPIYIQKEGKYVVASRKPSYEFDSRFNTIFPRMYSSNANHIREYQNWGGLSESNPITVGSGKNAKTIYKPSFGNNLNFFFRYQFNNMYWRYFMWNFAGRQNDIQNRGDIQNGNWLSGIKPLDEFRLGNQDKLYSELKNKKSRNVYFCLPLLLGLIGIFFQFNSNKEGKKDFWVVTLLFLLTGIAILIYLNQTPLQPRERDYAYAGSFYAFAIWIGFGVLGLYNSLQKKMPKLTSAALVTLICLIAVPGLMAQQNWDDHDRSGRYATLAYAKNYLNSCDQNAILFTYGDNDTFPLWYAQEVEGIRRDIRIVNISLLAGDWYINQMRRKAYDSDPIQMILGPEKIEPGVRDQIPVMDKLDKPEDLSKLIRFVGNDDKRTRLETQSGKMMDYFPGKHVYLPVDTNKVISNGTVQKNDTHLVVNQLNWTLNNNYLYKNSLMMLDIIASNNWERPIYFSVGMGTENYLGLEKYFQLEGATYRLVPIETKSSYGELGHINSDLLYNNLMTKFEYGRIKEPDVYMDQFHIITCGIMSLRANHVRLAARLNDENKPQKALEVLDRCMEELPISQLPIEYSLIGFVQEYYRAGAVDKANELLLSIAENSFEKIEYFLSLKPKFFKDIKNEQEREVRIVQMLFGIADAGGQKDIKDKIQRDFENLLAPYQQ